MGDRQKSDKNDRQKSATHCLTSYGQDKYLQHIVSQVMVKTNICNTLSRKLRSRQISATHCLASYGQDKYLQHIVSQVTVKINICNTLSHQLRSTSCEPVKCLQGPVVYISNHCWQKTQWLFIAQAVQMCVLKLTGRCSR